VNVCFALSVSLPVIERSRSSSIPHDLYSEYCLSSSTSLSLVTCEYLHHQRSVRRPLPPAVQQRGNIAQGATYSLHTFPPITHTQRYYTFPPSPKHPLFNTPYIPFPHPQCTPHSSPPSSSPSPPSQQPHPQPEFDQNLILITGQSDLRARCTCSLTVL